MSDPDTSATASLPSQRLLDKTAIATGASSGLGRAIALAYATHGAAVVCADLQPEAEVPVRGEDVKATHKLIVEKGGKSRFVECDVRDSRSVQNLITETVKLYGRLDIMVNNAGVSLEVRNSFLPVHETLDSTFTATMSINSRGVFLGCKYAAKQMITQDPYPSGDRGWIINIGSVAGLVGLVGAVSYSASKGAVVQMTRTVALDLAHPLQRPVSRLHEDGHDKTIWWTMRRDKLNLQQCIPSKASASQKTLQRQPFFSGE